MLDATGLTVLPGLIDCHVHAVFSGMDHLRLAGEPFSYQFYAAQRNLKRTLGAGVTTVRDAGGADLVVVSGDPFDFTDLAGRIVYVVREGRVVRDFSTRRPTA